MFTYGEVSIIRTLKNAPVQGWFAKQIVVNSKGLIPEGSVQKTLYKVIKMGLVKTLTSPILTFYGHPTKQTHYVLTPLGKKTVDAFDAADAAFEKTLREEPMDKAMQEFLDNKPWIHSKT